MAKKQYQIDANDEVALKEDFTLTGGALPTGGYVSSLFSSANTSLMGTIRYGISTTSSATMTDRTTNVYDMTASVTLVFPAQVSGKMRDFLLVVNVDASATTTAITLPSDVTSVGDTLTLTADKQYLIAFTEIGTKTVDSVEKALFYVRSIQL